MSALELLLLLLLLLECSATCFTPQPPSYRKPLSQNCCHSLQAAVMPAHTYKQKASL
jgi:hypothetical protein